MTLDQDDHITYIGLVRSPWGDEATCPPSDDAARQLVDTVLLDIVPEFRLGLMGLEVADRIIVTVWHKTAERDVLVQFPASSFAPRGVFAGRGLARPNPLGVHVLDIVHLDMELGLVTVEAMACPDGAAIIDLQLAQ